MFKCDVCSYVGMNKKLLKAHVVDVHNEKRFKCDICGYRTNRKFVLNRHTLKHSEREKNYKCDKCSFKTHDKTCLNVHKLKHTDINIKCHVCDYSTIHKHSLKRHIKIQHPEETGKVYKCENCNYETSYYRCLEKHYKVHDIEKNITDKFIDDTLNILSENIINDTLFG